MDLDSFKYLSLLGNIKNMEKNIFYYYDLFQTHNNLNNVINYLLNNNIITDVQIEKNKRKFVTFDLSRSNVLSKCNYILIHNSPVDTNEIMKFKQMTRKSCRT